MSSSDKPVNQPSEKVHPRRRRPKSRRVNSSTAMPENLEHSNQWFVESLTALGHFDPSIIHRVLPMGDNGELQNLVLWLEDRVIRLWDVPSRDGLRRAFQENISRYLNELECPFEYFQTSGAEDSSSEEVTGAWQTIPAKRTRVIYWLVSCAISEAYGDIALKEPPDLDPHEYPLGFTTGDPKVDQVLTALRKRHLVKLRKEQDAINASISRMQQITVEKSKPLKTRKKAGTS